MYQNNLELLNTHLKAENNHDLEGTLATIHPECIFEDVALNFVYKGKQGVAEYYNTWWNAFNLVVKSASRHWTTDHNVIVEPMYTGTHIAEFYGIPATGRQINIKLAVFVNFKDGLMIGEKFYYDTSALFEQLGVHHSL